jgi:hypothetical protein
MTHNILRKNKLKSLILIIPLAFFLSSCQKDEAVLSDIILIQGSWSLVSTRYASYIDEKLVKENFYDPTVPESISFFEGAYVKRRDNKVFQSGNYLLVDKVISFKSLADSIIVKEYSTLNTTSLITYEEEKYTLPNGSKETYLIEFSYKKR